MTHLFFEKPILNSPYDYPSQHWELDESDQPTQKIIGAWESLNSDTSRTFDKPKSGRIAVKVINHLGDEVMKVFKL